MQGLGRIRSDYDPDTCLSVHAADDGEISVDVFGKGKFRISGFHGGSHIDTETKIELVRAFQTIVKICNEKGRDGVI